MATREENIKKINYDLEKLSDEQLEQVAGGATVFGIASMSQFLYDYGLVDNWRGPTGTIFHQPSMWKMVTEGWAKAGIKFDDSSSEDKFILDGKQISYNEAVNHVKANFKQVRTHDDTWYR